MQKNEQSLAENVRNAGFRATRPRLALLAFLNTVKAPLNIQEIVDGLKGRVDPVTVYRMVDAFKGAGLVREVSLWGERPKYEVASADDDHHHIVCTKCHRIEDFVGCGIDHVQKSALQKSQKFATITGHSFDLYGVCNTCVRA